MGKYNQRLRWIPFWSGFVDTLWFGTSTPSETVNIHFIRSPDFDVTLSHVTDFPNDRWALRFRFFRKFRKKVQKVVQKAGTGWCLHLWLIDLKRGHFWSSFRIMRQTTKAHRACPPPQILPAKSNYFPKKRRTGFPRFCFASLNVKSASRNDPRGRGRRLLNSVVFICWIWWIQNDE